MAGENWWTLQKLSCSGLSIEEIKENYHHSLPHHTTLFQPSHVNHLPNSFVVFTIAGVLILCSASTYALGIFGCYQTPWIILWMSFILSSSVHNLGYVYQGQNTIMLCNVVILVQFWWLTLNVRGPSYLGLSRSISWLLMPWLLTSPWHQQPWYWLCRICRS